MCYGLLSHLSSFTLNYVSLDVCLSPHVLLPAVRRVCMHLRVGRPMFMWQKVGALTVEVSSPPGEKKCGGVSPACCLVGWIKSEVEGLER